MNTTATRLITLILLLQGKPMQKAADLADELGISVRTLHRYFGMLEEMGIPLTSERGPYGGFSLVQGYKMPPMVFTPEEAAALTLGTGLVAEVWGRLYREPARAALAKLEAVLPREQQREVQWASQTLVVSGLRRMDLDESGPVLEQLRQASRAGKQVRLTYSSWDQKETTRTVDPYTLVHRQGWWYLVGFCRLREDLRLFRVDRIQTLETLDGGFSRPEDFDVHAFLAGTHQEEPGEMVTLRVLPQAADLSLSMLPGIRTLEVQADGSCLVTLEASDLRWIASVVLSFGGWMQVVSPEPLRETVAHWASAVVAGHTPPEP